MLEDYKELIYFDINKFTIFGNPTITENGIASNFSGSNLVRIEKPISVEGEEYLKITFKASFIENSDIYFLVHASRFWIYQENNKIKAYLFPVGADALTLNLFELTPGLTDLDLSVELELDKKEHVFVGRFYEEDVFVDEVSVAIPTSANPSMFEDNLLLGSGGGFGAWESSIDLVSILMKVNNQTIFQGGIKNYIKPITDENINVEQEYKPSFDIDKNFIKLMIPDNLRDTWTFERVADIIYSAISDETESGKQIKKHYDDLEFYVTDFTKLSLEKKLAKLHDSGFDYLIEIFGSDEDRLNDLSAFLNLIKILKGRKEGFKLIMDTLGIVYTASSWEDKSYKNEVFTYDIVITLSQEQTQLSSNLINTIQNIARAYLAPQVNITYTVVEELLDETKYFDNRYSGGYMGKTYLSKIPEFTRSLT